jgi:hypothetical protein
LALITGAVLGVAAVIYFLIPSSHNGQSNTANGSLSTATGGQAAHSGPMPGAPTVKGGAKSAAPSGPKPLKPSDPAQVRSWNAASGGKALARVTTQSGNVLMAHAARQYPEMLQYCNALAGAVQTAEADSPIPDTAMQKMYAASLNAFKQGAADCAAGITQHAEGVEDTVTKVNHADVNRAVSELSVGINDLYIATEVLRKP